MKHIKIKIIYLKNALEKNFYPTKTMNYDS